MDYPRSMRKKSTLESDNFFLLLISYITSWGFGVLGFWGHDSLHDVSDSKISSLPVLVLFQLFILIIFVKFIILVVKVIEIIFIFVIVITGIIVIIIDSTR